MISEAWIPYRKNILPSPGQIRKQDVHSFYKDTAPSGAEVWIQQTVFLQRFYPAGTLLAVVPMCKTDKQPDLPHKTRSGRDTSCVDVRVTPQAAMVFLQTEVLLLFLAP
jgi:hypothetical protein